MIPDILDDRPTDRRIAEMACAEPEDWQERDKHDARLVRVSILAALACLGGAILIVRMVL